jgi:hypothetical protein
MTKLKCYSIPSSSNMPWNPEIHGLPYDEESEAAQNAEVVPVDWRPGEYRFNFGACGRDFVITVPEMPGAFAPNQSILRGFHAFLSEAL